MVLGGMVLLGGCTATGSVPDEPGRPPATDPTAPRPPAGTPAGCDKAAEPRAGRNALRGEAPAAGEQPVYYVHDGPRAIALTIDDGPSPIYTPRILQLLARYRVTAAFSMIGVQVNAYPGVAREVADAGHMIVNHTQTHRDLALMSTGQVTGEMDHASDAIHRATGRTPDMFRAPYGAWTPTVIRRCQDTGMTPLDWSVDPRDWARPGTDAIIANIMGHTRPGSIILEHDGGGNRSQTVAALNIAVPRLLDAGYHFVLPGPARSRQPAQSAPASQCRGPAAD
jgi:peptidoglycan/xylan/chitin deacetylase (PgdA/CDA1 family)